MRQTGEWKKRAVRNFVIAGILPFISVNLMGDFKDANDLILKKFGVTDAENQTIQIDGLDGNHVVGLKCDSEAWSYFNSHRYAFQVKLLRGDRSVRMLIPASKGTGSWCNDVHGCHYIFSVIGHGYAVIRILLPHIPRQTTTKILIFKSPEQTERSWWME